MKKMDDLQTKLDSAVEAGKVPQVVVFAESRDGPSPSYPPSSLNNSRTALTHTPGNFTYHAAAGHTSAGPDVQPIRDDAVFLLASQTKLTTSVAALQAVEQGLIGLDDDVAEFVPELAKQPILTGFDGEDEPVLVERKKAITLRWVLFNTLAILGDCRHLY